MSTMAALTRLKQAVQVFGHRQPRQSIFPMPAETKAHPALSAEHATRHTRTGGGQQFSAKTGHDRTGYLGRGLQRFWARASELDGISHHRVKHALRRNQLHLAKHRVGRGPCQHPGTNAGGGLIAQQHGGCTGTFGWGGLVDTGIGCAGGRPPPGTPIFCRKSDSAHRPGPGDLALLSPAPTVNLTTRRYDGMTT